MVWNIPKRIRKVIIPAVVFNSVLAVVVEVDVVVTVFVVIGVGSIVTVVVGGVDNSEY